MQRAEILALAQRVLTLPTAPYHEHLVRDSVTTHLTGLGLPVERDAAGNVIARYCPDAAAKLPPLVFVAHMDHPGFEALGEGRAQFLGNVVPEMFAKGAGVQFFTGKGVVRTRLARQPKVVEPRAPVTVELTGAAEVQAGDVGMWDFPLCRVQGDRLRAVAIDDVLSVAALLATMSNIVKAKRGTHVWAIFTRAEEVGFPGAIAVARSGLIPPDALVVSLEMSKQRPWARIGNGPVIRLGDRMTLFDPLASLFLQETAQEAAIGAQRAVMDGGVCEATAFAGFGYRVGGLCLPLGNYHNIGPGRRAAPEYVSVTDLLGLVALMTATAMNWRRFGGTANRLRRRVQRIYRSAPRKLADS